jgi:hypothetical protein
MIRSIQVNQFNGLIPDIQDKKIIINKITYGDRVVKYLDVKNDTDEMALFSQKSKDMRKPVFEEYSYHLFFEEGGEEVVEPDTIIDLDLKDDIDEIIAVPEISEPTPEELAEIVRKKAEGAADGDKKEADEELY